MESLAGLWPRQTLHTRFFQLGTMVVKYAGDAKRSMCASSACRAIRKRPLQEGSGVVRLEANLMLHNHSHGQTTGFLLLVTYL